MSGYLAESVLRQEDDRTLLGLETALGATPSGLVENPDFFSGLVADPRVVAAGLIAVADVAATKYFLTLTERGAYLDPVVTAGGDRLRFESFSACNGVYARFDLLSGGIDSGTIGFGTTNVDVNQPLRTALAGVGRAELLHLAVGAGELRVSTPDATHVERKVDLPDRWVRGLAEVPTVMARMTPAAEVGAVAAGAFLTSLPRSAPGPSLTVGRTPRGFGPVPGHHPGAVRLAGTARLGSARRITRFLRGLAVFGEPSGSSGWVFDLPGARLTLVLGPEPYRGFSGEGGLLERLAGHREEDVVAIGSELGWEPVIDADALARGTGLSRDRVEAALAALSVSGKVGYDLADRAMFHRELPLEADRVERDHPRLVAARKLVASGVVARAGDGWRVGDHRVGPGQECDCEWWFKHRGERGPCKHVLATVLAATSPVG